MHRCISMKLIKTTHHWVHMTLVTLSRSWVKGQRHRQHFTKKKYFSCWRHTGLTFHCGRPSVFFIFSSVLMLKPVWIDLRQLLILRVFSLMECIVNLLVNYLYYCIFYWTQCFIIPVSVILHDSAWLGEHVVFANFTTLCTWFIDVRQCIVFSLLLF